MSNFLNIDDVSKRHRFKTMLPLIGDEEGLMLACYQVHSEHTAEKILKTFGNVPVLEICCGVGAKTVFLAQRLNNVYSVDINKDRITAAKINAKTFGVDKNVTFIHGDGLDLKLLKSLKKKCIKGVVTDVDWRADSSHDLKTGQVPDISQTRPPTPGLYRIIKKYISQNIILHLTDRANRKQLKTLDEYEIERVYINREVKFIDVYFGEFVKDPYKERFIKL